MKTVLTWLGVSTGNDANKQTCETMDDAAKVAARWELGLITPEQDEWLRQWVKLRMDAYKVGGWDGEMGPMIEWIAIDLALDEKDARRICDKAGWAREAAQP